MKHYGLMSNFSVVNIKKAMAERGIKSQRELGRKADLSHSTMARIFAGTAKPENATVAALSAVLLVSRAYLFGEEPAVEANPNPERRKVNLESEPLIEIMGSVWATPFRLSMQQGLGQFIKGKPGEQDCFALRVEGDSMDPVYVAGDLVICRPHNIELLPDEASYVPFNIMRKYHNYDAIVEHEGDTMLKRIQLEQKRGPLYDLYMISLNPRYPKVKLRFGDDWKMKALVVRSEKPPIPE